MAVFAANYSLQVCDLKICIAFALAGSVRTVSRVDVKQLHIFSFITRQFEEYAKQGAEVRAKMEKDLREMEAALQEEFGDDSGSSVAGKSLSLKKSRKS